MRLSLLYGFISVKIIKLSMRKFLTLFLIFIGAVILTVLLFIIYPNFFLSRKITFNADIKNDIKEIPKNSEPSISFVDKNLIIKVELETTPYQWAKGLMFRENLVDDTGMLFVFPSEGTRTFWMKDTLIPIDIVFISKDLVVTDIKENFEPCPTSQFICPTYSSKKLSQYVLEVNAGFVLKNIIKIGDKIELTSAENN